MIHFAGLVLILAIYVLFTYEPFVDAFWKFMKYVGIAALLFIGYVAIRLNA